jgi:hypothetical protein
MTATAIPTVREQHPSRFAPVPLSRVVRVELRKMFNTRSGFWLLASIVIVALLTMVATVLFAPEADLTYYTFAKAIGFPMTVVLPIIAILSITGEWSQHTGLTTFTLVPHRRRVLLAKTVSSLVVGAAAMLFALAVGVIGNVAGSAIAGTDLVWDVSAAEGVNIVLGSLLCLLTGTMLGMLIRSSAGAWSPLGGIGDFADRKPRTRRRPRIRLPLGHVDATQRRAMLRRSRRGALKSADASRRIDRESAARTARPDRRYPA